MEAISRENQRSKHFGFPFIQQHYAIKHVRSLMATNEAAHGNAMIERMRATLSRVHALAGPEFSGIGLIVHNRAANLPVFPLRPSAKLPVDKDLERCLAAIALTTSDLHDGFHLLSVDWKLTYLSQYFSPPILANAEVNWKRNFGGRYLAAQFGSALPEVLLCGIATASVGLVIFKGGREIYFERL